MEYFDLLPEDITLDIISRLPTELVLECKLVCTNLRSLVRHPTFSKMHLHHLEHHDDSGKLGFIAFTYFGRRQGSFQYFEYTENHESTPSERIRRLNINRPFGWRTRFLGSSNGLICLTELYSERTYICNPITRECIMLPEIKGLRGHAGKGFGFVSSTNEYKVIRIMFEMENEFVEVYIYTLGSGNGWRSLGKFNLGTSGFWYEGGVFLNGVVYWMDYELIVSFDLAQEKFCENMSSPPWPPEDDFYDNCKLWVLDGCLSFAVFVPGNEPSADSWDVWLLKNKDDNHCMKELEGHQSLDWSKVFRVFHGEIFSLTKSYDVLTYDNNHINVSNPEASTCKRIVDFEKRIRGVYLHKNTFISLKELWEEDTKIMESAEVEETQSHAQPAVGG